MNTNPYETPNAEQDPPRESEPPAKRRPCAACGSLNTKRDVLTRTKPSILFVILFGWVFLLIRGAFAMRTDRCTDCGAVIRYKTLGSWIALVVLILVIMCMIAAMNEAG